MAYDFPASPSLGQIYNNYVWDGEKWKLQSPPVAGAVRYDVAQSLSEPQKGQARTNIGASAGQKNYIINGAMMVSQEYPATAVGGNGNFPVDMFQLMHSNAATQIAQQMSGATPGGSWNRLRLTITAADASVGAGDYLQLRHIIEGLRMAGLKYGSPAAKTVTLQFGCKGPAGTYCVTFIGAGNARYYVAEYTITAGEANTDVVKSITLTLDTTGAWDVGTGLGLDIRFVFMAGATYQTATLNTWFAPGSAAIASANQFNFAGSTSNVFELFDVSLTEGSVAPPFQAPDYASELALCKRYWQKLGGTAANDIWVYGYAVAANAITAVLPYPVEMRVPPTGTLVNFGAWQYLNVSGASMQAPGTTTANLHVTAAASGSVYFRTLNTTTYISLNARL